MLEWENNHNIDHEKGVVVELDDGKRTEDDNSIAASYVNQGIERGDDVTGQDNCQQDTDLEHGHDNQGLLPKTAMHDDGCETKF